MSRVLVIMREMERPVMQETWTPLRATESVQVCSFCWEVIPAGPAFDRAGQPIVRAYRCVERGLYECRGCGDERLRVSLGVSK